MASPYLRESNLRSLTSLTPEEDAERIYAEELADQGGIGTSLDAEIARAPSAAAREILMAERAARGGNYQSARETYQPEPVAPRRVSSSSNWRDAVGDAKYDGPSFDELMASLDTKKPVSEKKNTFADYAKDTALDAASGIVGFGESAVGVANLATFGVAGKLLEAIGYDPKQTKEFLAGMQSVDRKRIEQEIGAKDLENEKISEAAQGFTATASAEFDAYIDKAKMLGANPSALMGRIVQSLPSVFGAGAAARMFLPKAIAGAEAAGLSGAEAEAFIAKKVIGYASAAEGAMAAGSIAEQGRQSGREWSDFAAPAAAGGAITAAVGRGSGAIGRKLGIGDIESDIAGGAVRSGGTGTWRDKFVPRVLLEGTKEGLFEETPQSLNEAIMGNLATGEPWGKGVGAQTAEGTLAGLGMGAGHAALFSAPKPADILNAPTVDSAIDTATKALDSASLSPAIAAYDDLIGQQRQVRDANQQALLGDEEFNPGAVQPASGFANRFPPEPPRALTYHPTAGQLVVFPDGSAMTRAEYEQRKAQQEQSRLDGMVQDAPLPGMMQRAVEQSAPVADAMELNALVRDERADKNARLKAEMERLKASRQATPATPAPVAQQQQAAQPSASPATNALQQQYDAAKAAGDTATMRLLAPQINAEKQRNTKAPTEQPKTAIPFAIGQTPANAEPITVRNGVVYQGEYALEDYETGKPVTVPEGATHAQIRKAMEDAGQVPKGFKFFGEVKAAAPVEVAAPDHAAPVAEAPQRLTVRSLPIGRKKSPIMRRDDLVGAIMRVTGGDGIAANLAQTITGDTANNVTKLRGLFANNGNGDLDDVAMLLRVQEGYDIRDGNHLSDLISEAAAGNMTYSMERTERERASAADAEHREHINARASELGLKKIGGRRNLKMVEADIAREEKRLSDLEAQAEREAIVASEAIDDAIGLDMTEPDWMKWVSDDISGTYTQEDIDRAEENRANRENARAKALAYDYAEGQAQGGSRQGNGDSQAAEEGGGTETGARGAAEGLTLTGQTNAEAAAEFKRQQEEANKQDKEPPAKNVTADQVDLFNTQGGLFNSNRDGQDGNSGLAMQESAVYTVTEPDAVTGDLFPEELQNAVSATNRKDRNGRKPAKAGNGNLQSATALSVRPDAKTNGVYHVSTQLVTVGERKLPVKQVTSWDEAAQAFAYLSRYAVEHFDALVTDAQGKILAVIGSFKGAQTQASVYPGTVMMELSRINGAAHLWASHNHPSGLAELSGADHAISRHFEQLLRDTSVTYHGLSVMALNGDRVDWTNTGYDSGSVDRNQPAKHTVPIVEREVVESNPGEAISSAVAAKSIIRQLAGSRPGIVFLTAQNNIAAFVPFDPLAMGELRSGDNLMQLFGEASKAGASVAIVAMPDGKVTAAQFANLKGALEGIDVKVLDGIRYSSTDQSAPVESLAERGLIQSRGLNFYSQLRESESRATLPVSKAAVREITSPESPEIAKLLGKELPKGGKVGVIADIGTLPSAVEATGTRMSRKTAEAIRFIAQMFGRKAVFYEATHNVPEGINQDGKTLYVNVDSGVDALAVAGHEFTHSLQHTDPEAYQAALDAVKAILKADPARAKSYAAYYGKQDMDADALAAELLSDIGGNLWRDESFFGEMFAEVQRQHPHAEARSIITRLRDALVSFINKLIAATPKQGFQLEEKGLITREELESIKARIVKMAADAFIAEEKARVSGTAMYQPGRAGEVRNSTNRLASDTEEITLDSAPVISDEDYERLASVFLSDFPKKAGYKNYRRGSHVARAIRNASDAELGRLDGRATTELLHDVPLGHFSGYESRASVRENQDGGSYLVVELFGKEQREAGLDAEPALKLILDETGELTIKGPDPLGETYQEFEKRGWAEPATDHDGNEYVGWSRLTDVEPRQLIQVLGDTHARAKEWQGAEFVGLHWSRATGATGSKLPRKAAMYFSPPREVDFDATGQFWNDIEAGKTAWSRKEIEDVYAQGRRGTRRTAKNIEGVAGGSTTPDDVARATVVWDESIAGFNGYATSGRRFGKHFVVSVVPELFHKSTDYDSKTSVDNSSVVQYVFTPMEDGRYELSVMDPLTGGRAYNNLRLKGRLNETGGRVSVVLDNPYRESRAFLQEAVRRLALSDGAVPVVVEAGREGGARAGSTEEREFSQERIKARFSTPRVQQGETGKSFTLEVTPQDGQRFRDGVTAADEDDAIRFANFLWPDADVRVLAQKTFIPDLRYSLPRQSQWYYSQLSRAVDSAPEKVFGPAKQVSLWLQSNKAKLGIKDDELQWTGVLDWLATQQRVTKAEVLAYLDANGVQVQEVMKGEPDIDHPQNRLNAVSEKFFDAVRQVQPIEVGMNHPVWDDEIYHMLRDGSLKPNDLPPGIRELAQEFVDATAERDDARRNPPPPNPPTKYSQYVLPGGEDYRELLLTLPYSASRGLRVEKYSTSMGTYWRVVDASGVTVEKGFSNEAQAIDATHTMSGTQNPTYKSSHWEEPNILAHIRFNDRTDADGNRVLFIEELQSDWGQKGRDVGFANVSVSKADDGSWNISYGSMIDNYPAGRFASLNDAKLWATNNVQAPGVPKAPFVTDTKSWVALAVKRMIAHAVQNGYDKVAFVTGEQSAQRYPDELRRVADHIEWDTSSDGKGILVSKDGSVILRAGVGSDGIVGRSTVGKAAGKHLSELIGKDMAEQVMSAESGEISGENFTMDSHGMKTFYDRIVPQVVNDVLKKVGGGKVESVAIPSNGRLGKSMRAQDVDRQRVEGTLTDQPGFAITDAMREKVAGGQALFSTQRAVDELNAQIKEQEGVDNAFSVSDLGDKNLISVFKRVFDVEVVPVTPNTAQSSFFAAMNYGGRLYVNAQHEKAGFVQLAGHELLHQIANDMPETYRWFEAIARDHMSADSIGSYSQRPELQGYDKTGEDTYQEMVADFVGDSLADKAFLQALADNNPSMFKDFVRYVIRWLNDVSGKLTREGLGSYQYFNDVRDLQGYLLSVIDAYAKTKEVPRFSTQRIVGASNRQYTQAQQQAFANTGRTVDEKTTLEKLKAFVAKRWQQGIFDQFAPFRQIDMDAYTLMRLSKGSTGAFEALMHHGKLAIKDGAYDADTSGGVMERLFYQLGKESTDFLYWVAGNRAERLAKEGKENLFSPQDIAAYKSLASGTADFDYTIQTGPGAGKVTRDRTLIYADAQRVMNEFNKNVLDMAEESGLIDGDSRKLWEHEFYVPFYRVMEDDEGSVRGANISKGLVRQEAFKKLKGGTEGLNDLLANTLMNWAHLIDASAKNRAASAAIKAAENVGVARPAVHGEKNTVWYMDGGKKVEYKVEDAAVMEAITGLEYAGIRGPIMDILSKPKHWLTIGVTASPFFKVRNLIRDSLQAIGTSDLSKNPIANVVEGMKLTNRQRQEYVSALAGGGLIRFGTMLENNEAARTRQLIKKGAKDGHILDGEPAWRKAYDKWFEPAISAYNELGNRGEEINRMALYDQLRKKGVNHATASLMARDLMDFSLQGSFQTIRFLSQVVPFFNARLQGMYKLGRATKENREQMAFAIFASALAGLGLMALAAGDEDKWKKWKRREEWDKASYWWFEFGGMEFRIPKPFELGAVAHIAERTVEAMFDNERDVGKRWAQAMLDLGKNQLAMNPVPQAFKPIIDLYANKDSFTGRPIETMAMQRLAPTERYTAATSMPARGLSSAIGGALSPVQIDQLVRSYFGWMGATAVGAADMLTRAVNDEPTRPALDYFKFASGGMVKEDETSSRYVTQMYEQAAELEQAYATYNRMRKEGRLDEAKEYAEDNADKLKAYRSVEAVKKQEKQINERIRMIERSELHPAEKRIKIRELKRKQSEIAERLSRQ